MRTYRTVLEQKIKERQQTFEEFAEYVETFARDHGETGTLSVRHLQRLAAGRNSDGRPLGRVLPATARLLEHIFGLGIDELLAPPVDGGWEDESTAEIRRRLHVSGRIDGGSIAILQEQLSSIRRLDRQLGAVVAHDEVLVKSDQVAGLLSYSLSNQVRQELAAALSEFLCLAGWQALDLGRIAESWRHYDNARTAALSSSPSYLALAEAGRAFVLADAGEASSAVSILTEVRREMSSKVSRLLRAWLAAAHGETLAANGDRSESLRAFDKAAELLPSDSIDPEGPYVALDQVHLARWRGNALAQFADPDAVGVLSGALDRLDPTFIRAETGLRVDLATALAALDERTEARAQAHRAEQLAERIGSARQRRRMRLFAAVIS
jgi:tetratricopeptide (TPR) repeat protein